MALAEMERFDCQARAERAVLDAADQAAKILGTTLAIWRKCFIHPAVFEGYLGEILAIGLTARADAVLDTRAVRVGYWGRNYCVSGYPAGVQPDRSRKMVF